MANIIGEAGRAVFGDVGKDLADYLGRKFGVLPEVDVPQVEPKMTVPNDVDNVGALPKQSSGFDVYHGTPHNFPPVRELQMPDGTRLFQDLNESVELPEGATVLQEYPMGKFDITKIGTGEGAQVYGRGLYFAEEEDVAKMYRDQLSGGNSSAAAAKARNHKKVALPSSNFKTKIADILKSEGFIKDFKKT